MTLLSAIIRPLAVATFLAATITAAAQTPQAETYTLNVGEFSKLKVKKGINVDYRCSPDSAGIAVFTAPASTVSLITFQLDGDELRLDYSREEAARAALPTVRLYSSYLNSVENDGDSTVRISSVLPCPMFKATLMGNGRIIVRNLKTTRFNAKLATGNGHIVATGQCDVAALSMTGTGTIQVDGLEAKEVRIRAVGTGSIGCWATESLTIHGMGSTRVYYRGTPTLRNKALGVKTEPLP